MYLAIVTYNTSRTSKSRASYGVSIERDDETTTPTNRLDQVGPNSNNVVTYRGTFATKRAAQAAVRGYING